jgi:hypothetical protein
LRRFARVLVLVVATTVGVVPAGRADTPAAATVEVRIVETAAQARTAVPLVVAVPFARGALPKPLGDTVSLSEASGRVLERWPDGSARWLLAEFAESIGARAAATRRLSLGGRPLRSAVRISNASEGARAESAGFLTLSVPARGNVLASLQAAGRAAPVAITWPAVRLDAVTLPAPTVDRVEIESDGPLHGEILVEARQAMGLRHEVRLAVFAGQPWIRLRYTLTHMGEAPYLHLTSFPVVIPWRATRGELAVDGTVRPLTFAPPDRTHVVVQRSAGAPILDGETVGRHADGVARVSGDGRAWSVAVPWFWEEYPKSLAISPQGLEVDFAAAKDDPLWFGVGAAKTWELWIAVHPEAQAPGLVALGRALIETPRAFVSPARVVASGALPYAIAPGTPAADAFLATLRTEIDRYRARALAERWDDGPPGTCATRAAPRVRVGFYGAFNWGDWNFPGFHDDTKGCDAWGNLEYDLPLVLGLAYLATDEAEIWSLFDNAARHYRDVDVIHHWPGHSDRVGLNHPHKVRHFATDAPNTVDLGHVWLDGILLHYRLTGERRSLRAVTRMADALSALTARARNPRQFGWPMVALAAAYEATGEPRYRTACLSFAEQAARKFPPDPNAEWKMGILAEGMMAVHRATGDAGARHWLDDYGRQLLLPTATPRDPRLVVPAGYLFELTGDARYADLARTTAAQLAPGNWGKSLASVGRIGFALLGPLPRAPATATPVPDAPPPASPRESPRSSPPRAAPSPPSDR